MSKVVIEVDTESKEIGVSIDGAAVENVTSVSCYAQDPSCEYRTFSVNITTSEKSGDMRKYTHLCASKTEEAAAALKEGGEKSRKFPGFVETDKGGLVQQQLSALLKKRR